MAKKSGMGCGTIIGFFLLLMSLGSFAILGGSAYIAYDMATQPEQFFKKYASSVEFVAKRVMSALNSEDVSEVPEGAFDGDAYQSFLEKQLKIAQQFQNVQDRYDFEMQASEAELSSFLKQVLARWEVTRYSLDFDQDWVRVQASIPGHIFKRWIPQGLPAPITNSLDSLKQVNVDSSLQFAFDGGIKKFKIEVFQLGKISLAPWMLGLFNQRFQGEIPKLESWMKAELQSMSFAVDKLLFRPDVVVFSGSTTKSFR